MVVSVKSILVSVSMVLGIMLGTAVATVAGLGAAGLLAPVQAAPSVQEMCFNWPSLDGTWYREGNSAQPTNISQVNNRLTLTNEFGSVAIAELIDDVTFTVTESVSPGREGNRWSTGLSATLTGWNGSRYTVIDWGNGTTWRR